MLHLNGLPIKIVDLNRITAIIPREAVVMDNAVVGAPKNGQCTADGQFIWVAATATVPGHWERLRVGQTCDPANIMPGSTGPVVREHRADMPGSTPGGGVSVSPTRVMKVGPFVVPVVRKGNTYVWGLDDYSKLKPDQAAMIKAQITKKVDARYSYWYPYEAKNNCCEPGTTGTFWYYKDHHTVVSMGLRRTWPAQMPWGLWLTKNGWLRQMGLTEGEHYDADYMDSWEFNREKAAPIAQFNHPDGGHYGMWMKFAPVGEQIRPTSFVWVNPDGTPKVPQPVSVPDGVSTQSYQLQFMIAPMPEEGFFLWDWIKDAVAWVATEFYDAVWDAAEELSDALCALTATPGQLTAAASAAGPYGTAAGAATELLMDGKCPIPNPTPAGTPGPPQHVQAPVPWALIIGGLVVVAGVVLLGTKKSTP